MSTSTRTQVIQQTIKAGRGMTEEDLYAPFLRFLNITFEPAWSPLSGKKFFHSQIVTNQLQPGTWSNPDLLTIRFWRPEIMFGANLFIRTYELKVEGACGTRAIHQTLAHRSSAHEAYLVGYEPDWKNKTNYTQSVRNECKHFGIGLIFIESLQDHSTFAVLEQAERVEPSHEKADALLARHLDETGRRRVQNWRRGMLAIETDEGIS
jgi:hypothetical protein